MVFGGLTGVGIWWTIALLNPAATSALIHIFVFGWAAEWVFFVGEIVALFIYFYTFGKMDRKNHLIIGWIYFICAWMSLFLINGIIDFMLTPGAWIETQNFWDGFFSIRHSGRRWYFVPAYPWFCAVSSALSPQHFLKTTNCVTKSWSPVLAGLPYLLS